jgi:hypothetical protein
VDEDDLIFSGSVRVRAIPDPRGRLQPKRWLENLVLRDRRRADAGLDAYDLAYESKRGYAGRLEKIEGSKAGLLELKLTRGGSRGPQLRFLGVWNEGAFFVALAFAKTSPRINRRDIDTADRIVSDWRARREP